MLCCTNEWELEYSGGWFFWGPLYTALCTFPDVLVSFINAVDAWTKATSVVFGWSFLKYCLELDSGSSFNTAPNVWCPPCMVVTLAAKILMATFHVNQIFGRNGESNRSKRSNVSSHTLAENLSVTSIRLLLYLYFRLEIPLKLLGVFEI